MFTGCSSLHKDERVASYHFKSQTDSTLYKRLDPKLKQHPGKSGIVALINGEDALQSRIWAIREAQNSIDLQYYIWKDDQSGLLVLKELILAAKRGVQVRLLLDNFNETRYQKGFKILDQHPKIEVRLIDTNLKNLNRRMHNKSFTIDNQVSIIGGRNIGDEYFDIGKEGNFKDMDVLVFGPVVEEVSTQFDIYWNSNRSYPVDQIEKNPIEERDLKKASERLASVKKYQLEEPDFMKRAQRYCGDAHVVFDSPDKLEGKKNQNLSMQLRPGITGLKKELILISPYFVPGHKGMKTMKQLREKDVRIVVLTNSLLTTDIMSVFAGYKRYREDLIKMGVELYELKSAGTAKKRRSMGDSGSVGLHGKVLIEDRLKIFVGSLNLDPRSIDVNTEMGVVVDNSSLAENSAVQLLKRLPEIAFRVERQNKKLKWIETTEHGAKVHFEEPGETMWKKIKILFSSLIIPEQLL
jgi:putative cardiolipin synthase